MKNDSFRALQAMFPTCDSGTIDTILASHHGHLEKTIEDLLKIAPKEDPESLGMNSQYDESRLAKTKPQALRDKKFPKKMSDRLDPEYEPYSEAIAENQANEFQIMTDEELAQEMYKMEKRKDLEMYERAQSWFGLKKTYYNDEKKKPGLVKKLTGAKKKPESEVPRKPDLEKLSGVQKREPEVEVPVKGKPIVTEARVISPRNNASNQVEDEEEKSFELFKKVPSKNGSRPRSPVEILEMPEKIQLMEESRRNAEMSYKMPSSSQLREPTSLVERQELLQKSDKVRRNAELSYKLQQARETRSPAEVLEMPEQIQLIEQPRTNAEMSYKMPSSQQLREPKSGIERQEMPQRIAQNPAEISLTLQTKQESDPQMSIISLRQVVNNYKKTENVEFDQSAELKKTRNGLYQPLHSENDRESRYIVGTYTKLADEPEYRGADSEKSQDIMKLDDLLAAQEERRMQANSQGQDESRSNLFAYDEDRGQEDNKVQGSYRGQEESRSNLFAYDDDKAQENFRGPAESRSNLFAYDEDRGQEDNRVQGSYRGQAESRSNLFAYEEEEEVRAY